MITLELILLLLFVLAVKGGYFDHEQICTKQLGKYTPTDYKTTVTTCKGAQIQMITKDEISAKTACIRLVPFMITAAYPGNPTLCDYEVTGECPSKFYPMGDKCVGAPDEFKYTYTEAASECLKMDNARVLRMSGNHVPRHLYESGIEFPSVWVDVNRRSRLFRFPRGHNQNPILYLFPDALKETQPGFIESIDQNEKAHVVCEKDAEFMPHLYGRLEQHMKNFNQNCGFIESRFYCVTNSLHGHSSRTKDTTITRLHSTCQRFMAPLRFTESLAGFTIASLPFSTDSLHTDSKRLAKLNQGDVLKKLGVPQVLSPVYRKNAGPPSCNPSDASVSDYDAERNFVLTTPTMKESKWISNRPKTMCGSTDAALFTDQDGLVEAPFSVRDRVLCSTPFNPCKIPDLMQKCDHCILGASGAECVCKPGRTDVSHLYNDTKNTEPGSVCSCGQQTVDMIVISDSTGSINDGTERYNTYMMPFVRKLLHSLDLTTTRVALTQIDGNPRIIFDFYYFKDQSDIDRAIKQMPWRNAWTHTASVLDLAGNHLLDKGRPGAKKIIVMLTDGDCTYDQDMKCPHIKDIAQKLKDKGVIIIVIGLGSPKILDWPLFNKIASPGSAFGVDFDKLNANVARWMFNLSCD